VIDTHAHLDACDGDVGAVLTRARVAGVTRVISVGTDLDSCRETLAICEREEGVYAALGIHPNSAGQANDRDLAELRELLSHDKAVAVGETGLDFYRGWDIIEEQRRLFHAHLSLAEDCGMPVVIHCRETAKEVAETLAGFGGTVVLHCFSDPFLYWSAVERGYYVSFAGNVTYPKASELRNVAEKIPSQRLLAETDSPYLAPQAVRGKRNEPAHVMHTLEVLAEARGERPEVLARVIDENATAAFGLP
jgi:TatD DNase family protein